MLEINNTLVEMKNACHRLNNTLDTAEEKKISSINIWSVESSNMKSWRLKNTKQYATTMGQLPKVQQIHYGDIGEEIKDKK